MVEFYFLTFSRFPLYEKNKIKQSQNLFAGHIGYERETEKILTHASERQREGNGETRKTILYMKMKTKNHVRGQGPTFCGCVMSS